MRSGEHGEHWSHEEVPALHKMESAHSTTMRKGDKQAL